MKIIVYGIRVKVFDQMGDDKYGYIEGMYFLGFCVIWVFIVFGL